MKPLALFLANAMKQPTRAEWLQQKEEQLKAETTARDERLRKEKRKDQVEFWTFITIGSIIPVVVIYGSASPHYLRQSNRAVHVEFASTLLKHIEVRNLLSRVHENHFHHVRREVGIGLNHQSGRTCCQWCGH